jgi:hypothetical protein
MFGCWLLILIIFQCVEMSGLASAIVVFNYTQTVTRILVLVYTWKDNPALRQTLPSSI